MRITFLLSTVGLPRHRQRIRALRRLGVDANVLAFAREGHLKDDETPGLQVLGNISNEEILRRSAVLLRALPRLREAARRSDVLYAFGPDQLMLAQLAIVGLRPRPLLVVEIGDLHPFLVQKRPAAALGRMLERLAMQGDRVLVCTSPGFIEHYYEGMQGLANLRTLVIENKVDPEVTPPPLPRNRGACGPIRIGWFGVLRCERSWEVLQRVAREGRGRFEIDIRGVPLDRLADLPDRVGDVPHALYGGRFSVPEDLAAMYGAIDLCWMVHHDAHRPFESWRWARSNRLYQAGWFRTPIVGQANKDDSTVVAKHDLGVAVDVADPDAALETLLAIDHADIERWRDRFEQVPRSVFALGDEHERLLALLRT